MSTEFCIGRGVKQGSVLSPTLFIILMDPLLQQLESSKLGLTINGFYAGGFIHADDIRTLSSSSSSLKEQMEIVKSFNLPRISF